MRVFCKVSLDATCETCRGVGIYEVNYIGGRTKPDRRRELCPSARVMLHVMLHVREQAAE